MQALIDPPLEITTYLDRLQSEGKRIVPGSLIWLPHPTKPGWMIAAVKVEAIPKGDWQSLVERKESL